MFGLVFLGELAFIIHMLHEDLCLQTQTDPMLWVQVPSSLFVILKNSLLRLTHFLNALFFLTNIVHFYLCAIILWVNLNVLLQSIELFIFTFLRRTKQFRSIYFCRPIDQFRCFIVAVFRYQRMITRCALLVIPVNKHLFCLLFFSKLREICVSKPFSQLWSLI